MIFLSYIMRFFEISAVRRTELTDGAPNPNTASNTLRSTRCNARWNTGMCSHVTTGARVTLSHPTLYPLTPCVTPCATHGVTPCRVNSMIAVETFQDEHDSSIRSPWPLVKVSNVQEYAFSSFSAICLPTARPAVCVLASKYNMVQIHSYNGDSLLKYLESEYNNQYIRIHCVLPKTCPETATRDGFYVPVVVFRLQIFQKWITVSSCESEP
jgi:hypothetical protein